MLTDPSSLGTLSLILNSLGYGAWIPTGLAIIGLASTISTIYPQTWPGAGVIHSLALLLGKATPASPAAEMGTITVVVPKIMTAGDAMNVMKKAMITMAPVTVVAPLLPIPGDLSKPTDSSNYTNR